MCIATIPAALASVAGAAAPQLPRGPSKALVAAPTVATSFLRGGAVPARVPRPEEAHAPNVVEKETAKMKARPRLRPARRLTRLNNDVACDPFMRASSAPSLARITAP